MTESKEEPVPNSDKEDLEHMDANQCDHLRHILEREAYASVVNALRAKGPPSEHTLLLLDHLRSALSINTELGRAEIRRAAVDPNLSKIATVLNPHYDTYTEWVGCATETRGEVEAGPRRGKPFAATSTLSIADQLRQDAASCSAKINQPTDRGFELLAITPKPFVPERLRAVLRETDRPEQRVAPPLEGPPAAPAPIEEPSVEKPPPAKKPRKKRTSKAAKSKENPSELLPENDAKKDEEIASTTAAAHLVSPLAAGAVVSSSTVTGSTITTISQGASAKKKGGDVQGDGISASISIDHSYEPITKKKRRSKYSPVDLYYLNSSARTRPFQPDRTEIDSGKTKPTWRNPDERCFPNALYSVFLAETAASQTAGPSATPVAPSPSPFATPSGRKTMDEVANYLLKIAESGAAAAAASCATEARPATSTNVQKPPIPAILPPAPPRYIVNNSGVVGGNPATPSTVKASSNVGGIGGSTASLGNQQLHAATSSLPLVNEKASSSNSSSSITSTGGGSMGSTIGSSSSCSSVLSADPHQPVTALRPESATIKHSTAPAMGQAAASNGRVQDSVGAPRSAPRVVVPNRWANTSNRLPGVASPQLVYNGMTNPPSLLRAVGSVSAMRTRLVSGGTAPAAVTAGVGQSGTSDGTIPAIARKAHLETAQKESAHVKRTPVMPNGALNHQSAPSMQSIHPNTTSRPSTSSDAAVSSSSMIRSGLVPQSLPPPSMLTALPPAPPPSSVSSTVRPPPPSISFSSLVVPSSTGILRGTGPSTSSAALAAPATSQLPADPVFAAFFEKAVIAISQAGDSIRDHCNQAVANVVVVPKEQQQQPQQPQQQQRPAAPPVPPRSAHKPYVLQPQRMPGGYAEFKPGNAFSHKSFATDGTPVEYGVSLEELHDRRVIARASTRGMTGGGRGRGAVSGNALSYKSFAPDGTPVEYGVSQEELHDRRVLARASTRGMTGGGRGRGAVRGTRRVGIPSSYSMSSSSRGVVHLVGNGQMRMLDGTSSPSSSSTPRACPSPSPIAPSSTCSSTGPSTQLVRTMGSSKTPPVVKTVVSEEGLKGETKVLYNVGVREGLTMLNKITRTPIPEGLLSICYLALSRNIYFLTNYMQLRCCQSCKKVYYFRQEEGPFSALRSRPTSTSRPFLTSSLDPYE